MIDRLALVAVGDLAVGARRLLAHVGEQRGRQATGAAGFAPGLAASSRRRRCAPGRPARSAPACGRRATASRRPRAASARRRRRRAAAPARPSPSRSGRGRSRRRSWSSMSVCSRAARGSPSSASTAARVAASTGTGVLASAATSAFRRSRIARRRLRRRGRRRRARASVAGRPGPWRSPAAGRCPTNRRRAGASRWPSATAGRRARRRAPRLTGRAAFMPRVSTSV